MNFDGVTLFGGFGIRAFDSEVWFINNSTMDGAEGHGIRAGDTELHVINSTIRNSGNRGVIMIGGSLNFSGSTSEDNGGNGVELRSGARGSLNGNNSDNVIERNANGVVVVTNAVAAIFGENLIQDNRGSGVQVTAGGWASIFSQSIEIGLRRVLITRNRFTGLFVSADAGASVSGGETEISDNNAGGVFVGSVSRLQFSGPNNTIKNNGGFGVEAQWNSAVFLGSTAITGNADGGALIIRGAVSQFFGDISGNGGPSISCDETALVTGDLTGIKNIDCRRIERETGPPRGGTFHAPDGP